MKNLAKLLALIAFSFVALSTEAQEVLTGTYIKTKPMTAEQYQKLIQLIPADLSQKDAQYWIEHPGEFSVLFHRAGEIPSNDSLIKDIELTKKKIQKIVIDRQKQDITKFYQECFGIKVDWKDIAIPSGPTEFKHLELILQNLTEDQIFDAYAKKFGEDKVWKLYVGISVAINREKGGEALRPKSNYAILHLGGDEPDAKHLNKSYNDFCDDGNQYMIIKEGMIAAMRYRFETNKMYDVKGLTIFHSLDSNGLAMDMDGSSGGRFDINGDDRGNRHSSFGPRQVVF